MTAPQGHPIRFPSEVEVEVNPLENATDEEIRAEFDRRLKAKVELRNKRKWDDHDVVCANIDALLAFRPNHSKSCTDNNPYNDTASPHKSNPLCTRCQLLHIKRNIDEGNPRYTGPYTVMVELVYNQLEK